MKILITNDDGFDSCGHLHLKKLLRKLGHEVWSIAPQQNQSGVGMKLTMGQSLEFHPEGDRDFACSGTPVDCVLFALHGILPQRPDAVISGINAGANLSDDLWYSGTAGAAREASKWGLPALALSYSAHPPYDASSFAGFDALLQQHLDDLLQACELQDANQNGTAYKGFLNINIPPQVNGQISLASRFERRPYQNKLQKTGENSYLLSGVIDPEQALSQGVDAKADANSRISISLGSFHALQPLVYQISLNEPGPLQLRVTQQAQAALQRVIESGLS